MCRATCCDTECIRPTKILNNAMDVTMRMAVGYLRERLECMHTYLTTGIFVVLFHKLKDQIVLDEVWVFT